MPLKKARTAPTGAAAGHVSVKSVSAGRGAHPEAAPASKRRASVR